MSLIEISYTNYLDSIQKIYKKILVVNMLPNDDTFKTIIKGLMLLDYHLSLPHIGSNCIYAITNPNNKNELLELEHIGLLFNFLVTNNFQLHSAFNDVIKHKD